MDQGNYKCKAHNFLGETDAEILMVVEVSEPEGDNYLLLVGGILVAFVVVAIFIVAGTYAKKYRLTKQSSPFLRLNLDKKLKLEETESKNMFGLSQSTVCVYK